MTSELEYFDSDWEITVLPHPNAPGMAVVPPCTHLQQLSHRKKVKIQQQICWIQTQSDMFKCNVNWIQHKTKYIHVYSKLFVNVLKYKYLEKALANKNEGHYEVRTINTRNACDYNQIIFLISIAENWNTQNINYACVLACFLTWPCTKLPLSENKLLSKLFISKKDKWEI